MKYANHYLANKVLLLASTYTHRRKYLRMIVRRKTNINTTSHSIHLKLSIITLIYRWRNWGVNWIVWRRVWLPWWFKMRDSTCHAGDTGLIPGSGRSPRVGNGHPLQYPCLKNSMDRGAWQATFHGFSRSWTRSSLKHKQKKCKERVHGCQDKDPEFIWSEIS